MRSEENILAGLKEAEQLAFEKFNELSKAMEDKDWIRAYNIGHDIQVSCIAIASVQDACFGED